MQFRAEFNPSPFQTRVRHSEKILLVGSCFTEQIGNKLEQMKFSVLQNPNGILFNPASISKSLKRYADPIPYMEEDLFYYNELWASWDHHSRFSGPGKTKVLSGMNDSLQRANTFLKECHWLIITLGSAFVYERNEEYKREVVANCHKVPTDKFRRRLLSAEEVKANLQAAFDAIFAVRPYLNVILTISPVRHLREGFVENNRSKANLITAVHELTGPNVFYFPSYELIIDDLRDYRFYAEDLVHPNYSATNYVWEKFIQAAVDPGAMDLLKEIAIINNAYQHKPFNPASAQHQKFMEQNLQKCIHLKERFPYLDLEEEIIKFSGSGHP